MTVDQGDRSINQDENDRGKKYSSLFHKNKKMITYNRKQVNKTTNCHQKLETSLETNKQGGK